MLAATTCRSPRQPQPAEANSQSVLPYASCHVPSKAPFTTSFIVPNWYRKGRAFQNALTRSTRCSEQPSSTASTQSTTSDTSSPTSLTIQSIASQSFCHGTSRHSQLRHNDRHLNRCPSKISGHLAP